MTEENRFINSEAVEDVTACAGGQETLCWGSTESYDLTEWNDTPPHENGEGWDGSGFERLEAAGAAAPVTPEAPAQPPARPEETVFVEP